MDEKRWQVKASNCRIACEGASSRGVGALVDRHWHETRNCSLPYLSLTLTHILLRLVLICLGMFYSLGWLICKGWLHGRIFWAAAQSWLHLSGIEHFGMQGVIFLGFAQGSILDAIQTWKCNLEGRDVSFFLVSVKHSWQALCILGGTEVYSWWH